ncbi:MAG: hypothetical protein MOGMAGMI_01583 [Candidatus Omnitrophica bacterium]|nr:hypothetical protein [Candidatus Omnitrophota bacterium]
MRNGKNPERNVERKIEIWMRIYENLRASDAEARRS